MLRRPYKLVFCFPETLKTWSISSPFQVYSFLFLQLFNHQLPCPYVSSSFSPRFSWEPAKVKGNRWQRAVSILTRHSRGNRRDAASYLSHRGLGKSDENTSWGWLFIPFFTRILDITSWGKGSWNHIEIPLLTRSWHTSQVVSPDVCSLTI